MSRGTPKILILSVTTTMYFNTNLACNKLSFTALWMLDFKFREVGLGIFFSLYLYVYTA